MLKGKKGGKTGRKMAAIIALLIAALIPARYTGGILGYLPGLGVLTLIFLSLLYLYVMRRCIRFDTEALGAVCEKGETVNVGLKIRNNSFLSCPKTQAVITMSGYSNGENLISQITFSMLARSGAEFPIKMKMNHIGVYEIGVKNLQIFDLLGIFSIALNGDQTFRVTVLPRAAHTEEIALRERLLTENRFSAKSTVSDGFDYTGVREYELGDSMKRIHWKLSAHSYHYMTKITESSRRNDLTVMIDFTQGISNRHLFPEFYDCLVETALSLLEQALRKDVEYSLFFVGRENETIRVIPKGEEDYENLVQQLPVLSSERNSGMIDGAGLMEQERRLDNKSANIILCTSSVTEQLIQEMTTVRQQQRNPELYYIVPQDHDPDRDPESMTLLGTLDDYGILYHLIRAENPTDKGSFCQ
jgi:uncharacterized protein (DUF58 family)